MFLYFTKVVAAIHSLMDTLFFRRALAEIISGVPQGSFVCPTLFNILFNDFFYFILVASAHNFADGNTLASFAKTI